MHQRKQNDGGDDANAQRSPASLSVHTCNKAKESDSQDEERRTDQGFKTIACQRRLEVHEKQCWIYKYERQWRDRCQHENRYQLPRKAFRVKYRRLRKEASNQQRERWKRRKAIVFKARDSKREQS